MPSLDRNTLARLRELVRVMHANNGRPLPLEQLVHLARDVQLDAGVTVDFEASRELGQPMVVLRMKSEGDRPAQCFAALSRREREVAALIADGLSNKEIGRRLFISLATVKDHVHHILARTALPNRAAVAAAYSGHTLTPHNGPGSPGTGGGARAR